MNQFFMRGLLLAFLALGFNQQALAHVFYTDISSNDASNPYYDSFTYYGWQQGTTSQLATTDDVNWYSFTLTQTSDITLSITAATAAQAAANGGDTPLAAPAFSLYNGLFVTNSYDVNPLIPLDGHRGLVNTTASFSLTTDTTNLAQAQADLRTITYITSATDHGTGTAELVNYLLGPGSYSVVAGGNIPNPNPDEVAQSDAWITFTSTTVTAVPVPGAFWLMSSALLSLGFFGRRKNQLEA